MPVSETGWHTPQDEAIEALFATRMGPHQVPLAQKLQDPMYLQTQGAQTGYGADTVIDTGGPSVDPYMAMQTQRRGMVPRQILPVDPNHPMLRALQQDQVY
jgi:hypothetical protein